MTPRLIRGGHRRDGKSPCPEPCTAPWQGNEEPQSTYEPPLQLAKADRSFGVEMKPSPVREKRLEGDSPEPHLSLSELCHVPCASEARSGASSLVYYMIRNGYNSIYKSLMIPSLPLPRLHQGLFRAQVWPPGALDPWQWCIQCQGAEGPWSRMTMALMEAGWARVGFIWNL